VVGGKLADAVTSDGLALGRPDVVSCLAAVFCALSVGKLAAGCALDADAVGAPAPAVLGVSFGLVSALGSVFGPSVAAGVEAAATGMGAGVGGWTEAVVGGWPRTAPILLIPLRYSEATSLRKPGCVSHAP
jgi:hypothetical protein